MGLFRDENGLVFEVDDTFGHTHGYERVSPEEEHAMLQQQAYKDRAADRGALGTINAGTSRFMSGLTLGGTDYLLGEILTDEDRATLLSDIEAHPYVSTGAELGGALTGAFAVPGSAAARTPAGYLGSLAAREAEAGVLQGGVRGTAKALNVMGVEGAAQSAGQYIGWSSLQDKDVTAEGLAGAVGTGYGFGAVGGGAALGVSKGTIAARRLFSRAMDGSDDAVKAAESSWTKVQEETLEADRMTAATARERLEEIRKAKMEAMRYRDEAKAAVQEEELRAAAAKPAGVVSDFEASIPTDVRPRPFDPNAPLDIKPATGGDKTLIRQNITFEPGDAARFDQSLPTLDEGPQPLVPDDFGKPAPGDAATSVKRRDHTLTMVRPGEVATDLEKQLAATKQRIDAGESIKNIKEKPMSEKSAAELSYEALKAADDRKASIAALQAKFGGEVPKADTELLARAPYQQQSLDAGPQFGPKKQRFGNLRTQLGEELDVGPRSGKKPTDVQGPTLREMRMAKTEELLGKAIAKEEDLLMEVLDEWDMAAAKLPGHVVEDFSDIGRTSAGTNKIATPDEIKGLQKEFRAGEKTGAGKSIAILDRAYEEVLQRASTAADPITRGEAVMLADELERVLEGMRTGSVQSDRGVLGTADWMREIEVDTDFLRNYQKASKRLAETVGDGAHPVSQQYAKLIDEAEAEAVNKATDRATRAVEDAEQFGPEFKTPEERVSYARERRIAAGRAYDQRKAELLEAKHEAGVAKRKLAESEKAKAAALRTDAKSAKTSAVTGKATTFGGILEIADLPGMPKPSDIPVIGPLLGAYLKYKTIKAALGRAGGRVAATPDARVAALAARTRDRVARAVDKSLGAMSRGSATVGRAIPQAAAVLSKRIYDDGGEDAPKGAALPELAAVRMRELQAYVTTPMAIEMDVRRELRGVSDPDIIAAAEKHRRAMFEYLASTLPTIPEQSPLEKAKWAPHVLQALSFARRMEAATDPAGVLERVAATQKMISLEAAETLRVVYPQMFAMAQARILQKAAEMPKSVPYSKRVHLSLVYQLPLDSSLDPDRLKMTQSVFEKTATPAPVSPDQPAQPPTPSVAQPTDISASYVLPGDRRAMR